jgi:hypothetical protein
MNTKSNAKVILTAKQVMAIDLKRLQAKMNAHKVRTK